MNTGVSLYTKQGYRYEIIGKTVKNNTDGKPVITTYELEAQDNGLCDLVLEEAFLLAAITSGSLNVVRV